MSAKKVLQVLHNHPAHSPGGTEAYTLRLFEAMRQLEGWDPLLVAREPAAEDAGEPHIRELPGHPGQLVIGTNEERYDKFFMTSPDKRLYTELWTQFLLRHRPDVVHFQHTLFLGVELISTTRRVLPDTPIVYTLHEYLPICNHYGQLLRTRNKELCLEASPRRCNECFPQIAPQQFFLRQRFIQSHFSDVDLFIAPSRFLMQRYIDWGIPRSRIIFEEHGFPSATAAESAPRSTPNRFGFFGVMTPFKGIDVLLRAVRALGPAWNGHLWIHGANYEAQLPEVQAEIEELLEQTSSKVTFAGPYDPADLPRMMADIDWVVVPSIWWENSPLVIREAFQHRRPVICSGIGGMAEKVEHGVSGLHFPVGDQPSLSRTLQRAAYDKRLWQKLHDGIPQVRSLEAHVARLTGLYRGLIDLRRRETDRDFPLKVAG
jgi:glycosyltransferase involved in cell wall biosynthesis